MDSVSAKNQREKPDEDLGTVDQPPTDDHAGYRRIPDKFPPIALLILVVELGERFTYFGLSGPMQNYINNPYDPWSDLPGALGKGQAVASALGNFFKFWAYASTIIGAIVADQYVGKFKAITISLGIYIIGLTVLVATATPAALHSNASFGGLIAAMVIIGLGTGGIKANVTPMCAEQYQNAQLVLKTLKSGERVVVDPELTVQRLFMWFYWVVNVGALSPLITVNVEAKKSFWLAYLIPLIAIILSAVVFLSGQKRYVKVPPQGSAIIDACKVLNIVRQEDFDNAKPSALEAAGRLSKYPFASSPRYTDQYVSDVRRGFRSCRMFIFFPFYFVCWVQIWNNLISQAGQMALHGTPNDLLQNLDPIALCIFIPVLDLGLYPFLRKLKINFSPVCRIFTGFLLVSFSMVYASVLQHYIYISPANSIHVWIQAPSYIFVAISEAFVIVTGLELAFTHAPKSDLRSFVSALFWLMIGIAAAICIGLSPVSQDPYLVWMYGSLAIVGFVAGCIFYLCFRKSDSLDPDTPGLIEGVPVQGQGGRVTHVTDYGKHSEQ